MFGVHFLPNGRIGFIQFGRLLLKLLEHVECGGALSVLLRVPNASVLKLAQVNDAYKFPAMRRALFGYEFVDGRSQQFFLREFLKSLGGLWKSMGKCLQIDMRRLIGVVKCGNMRRSN